MDPKLNKPGRDRLTMAVNVSALEARHAGLDVDVRRTLLTHQLAPCDLILELTESALLQGGRSTLTNLRSLREEGVGIAIDDVGTGYASLRYLATLPVSAVKIDKLFTAALPGDETSRKIVRGVTATGARISPCPAPTEAGCAASRWALPTTSRRRGTRCAMG
jgi:EAL domain-containing protein (putative c-di-GMP-specific phosphodiesterase class I)